MASQRLQTLKIALLCSESVPYSEQRRAMVSASFFISVFTRDSISPVIADF